jgi:hypothetical protein
VVIYFNIKINIKKNIKYNNKVNLGVFSFIKLYVQKYLLKLFDSINTEIIGTTIETPINSNKTEIKKKEKIRKILFLAKKNTEEIVL